MKTSPRSTLRISGWVAFLTVVVQVSLGALLISGQRQLQDIHSLAGHLTLAVVVIVAGIFIALRRAARALVITTAIVLAAMVLLQYATGESGMITLHALTGILIALGALLLAMWS